MDVRRVGKLTAWSLASWARPIPSWLRVHLTFFGSRGALTGESDFQEGRKLGWPQACIRLDPLSPQISLRLRMVGQDKARDG